MLADRLRQYQTEGSTFLRSVWDKGFFHLLSANVFVGIMGFASQLFVAKLLSPTELGQIRAMQSILSVATLFAGFGFSTVVLKLVSELNDNGQKAYVLRKAMLYSIAPTALVTVGIIGLAIAGVLSPDAGVNSSMFVFVWTIPAGTYISLYLVYLQALKRVQRMALIQTYIRIAGFILIVGSTFAWGMRGFLYATVGASVVACLPIVKAMGHEIRHSVPVINFRSTSLSLGGWALAANVLHTVTGNIDLLILNYALVDRESLGFYGLATLIAMALSFITSTVQSMATPYFSEKSSNEQEFSRVFAKYQRIMVIVSAGVAAAAALLVPTFIALIYGDRYVSSGEYVQWLSVRYFFVSTYALYGSAVVGLGRIGYNVASTVIMVIVSGVATWFMVERSGASGAAMAQAASSACNALVVILISQAAIRAHFFKHAVAPTP